MTKIIPIPTTYPTIPIAITIAIAAHPQPLQGLFFFGIK